MCIYVIIKIAQLVTYDDYRSILGTETHTHTNSPSHMLSSIEQRCHRAIELMLRVFNV